MLLLLREKLLDGTCTQVSSFLGHASDPKRKQNLCVIMPSCAMKIQAPAHTCSKIRDKSKCPELRFGYRQLSLLQGLRCAATDPDKTSIFVLTKHLFPMSGNKPDPDSFRECA